MKVIKYLYLFMMVKRYICSDGIHTLAYGHKDILRNE